MNSYDYNVFINCPFDIRYRKLFRTILFAVIDCGFNPRCALEVDDSSEERLTKIMRIIANCRLGIHDISKTQLDPQNRLPRFNMPLELGIFLSAKHFGVTKQKKKQCLVVDKDRYRYQMFISDISGKDIKSHDYDVPTLVRVVRDWLSSFSRETVPSGGNMSRKYDLFLAQLPKQCKTLHLIPSELTFGDYTNLAAAWIEKYSIEKPGI